MRKMSSNGKGTKDPWLSTLSKEPDPVFGGLYFVWRRLQHGQEKVIRWGNARERFGGLRPQTGHDHRCSLELFALHSMIEMRPYGRMDEALAMGSFRVHDVPEGVAQEDKAAFLKTDKDDLHEYMLFLDLCSSLPMPVVKELQRHYLIQHALDNPKCFPADARKVMRKLKEENLHEVLFFQGIQNMDYILYAYEGYRERKVHGLLKEVVTDQFKGLESIARRLPGFREAVWTKERSDYFKSFLIKDTSHSLREN